MKYYPFTFNDLHDSRNSEYIPAVFTSEYEALEAANTRWNQINKDTENPGRLLVIKKTGSETEITASYAFFQFTDSKSCIRFINEKHSIIWSDEETRYWNGNAHYMT